MFDRLSEGFSSALRKISGQGRISDANIAKAVEEVRAALLEADVHYDAVTEFCAQVTEAVRGREVTRSLKPGQEFIGVVHQELIRLMSAPEGATPGVLRVSPGPTIVMMCGLQGSGKTTTCGKLAGYLKKSGRSCMLVAADLQRPAAIEQLRIVCEQVQRELPGGATVRFYAEPDKAKAYGEAVGVAVDVCKRAVAEARKQGIDTVILDTAGRLHVDDGLMTELSRINSTLAPHQIFLVVDSMVGQDAVISARAFNERLEVDGVILTKFDSDTRGGAALSVRRITGAPIKFMGVGEKLEQLEEFHADRVAGRILGMGDVVSLVEKAQEQVSEEEAQRIQEKMARGEFTMDDFLGQVKSLRKMGPLKQIMGMLPGVGSALKDLPIDDAHFDKIEAIINSMTRAERADIKSFNNSRRKRVAEGAGVNQQDVGRLVKQFDGVSKMTKQLAGMGAMGKMKAMRQLQSQAATMHGGGMGPMGFRAKGSSKMESPKTQFKKRKKR
jgi:signal recognition particle subunit SRP54